MQIKSFRIRKYRNIQDSGKIELSEHLTCIVGKNQSGKTALLRALHKFNPHESEPYDIRREWPRGERRERNDQQIACEVEFRLDETEKTFLAELTSEKMKTDTVLVTKDYGGHFEIQFPDQPDLFPESLHPTAVDKICEALPQLSESVGKTFKTEAKKLLSEVRRLSGEGRFSDLPSLSSAHQEKLNASLSPDGEESRSHEQAFVGEYLSKLQDISGQLEGSPTMHQEAHEYVVNHLPTFIYMDDYKEFRGTKNLNHVNERLESDDLDEEDETFLMILQLAGLDLDELIRQGESTNEGVQRERQYDLQDAASTLTNDVAGRWGQNPYKVQFRVDKQTFFTEIEEADKDIGMIPLEEQSKGFRWFFSFDLRFMHDSDGTFEGCVLLLDEPGLHLHPGGQDDLLQRLDEYSSKNTLIYTTHFPFLVDLREPSRIRVISQAEDGAIVLDNLGASQPDEKLTLQAALGMRLTQSYLVSRKNLVVEGIHDYWLITAISNLFERSNIEGLPDELMLTAAGGATEVVNVATFMIGQELEVVALFDSDKEVRSQEERLRKKWLTRYKDARSETLLLGKAVGENKTTDFTIEDLFPETYYLKHLRESHKQKLASAHLREADLKIQGNGRILPRAREACARAPALSLTKAQ